MKQGRTLPELATELQRQANAKRDFLTPARDIRFRSNGHTELHFGEGFQVNDIAHSQIAEYAGVPKPFYDRLRTAASELKVPIRMNDDYDGENVESMNAALFDVVLNRLLESKGDDARLVRTLDGTARAFLSHNFNPDIDNYDVIRVAAKAMEQAGLKPDNVVSSEVTERKLYLKVVSPRLQAVVQPGNIRDRHGYLKEPQVVQAGFILTNSETGLGALSVQQVVVKLMCTNLWILESTYRQRHVGKALEADEDGGIYRSDTRMADAKARLLKIRDHVESALDETKFMALVVSMQDTAEAKLSGSVEKIVETTARKFGLQQSEKDEVFKNLIEGADLSLWGLSNAITATAQNVDSYDRATELEAIGGRFFTLPKSELQELARAA
jgi:hypothetical protein